MRCTVHTALFDAEASQVLVIHSTPQAGSKPANCERSKKPCPESKQTQDSDKNVIQGRINLKQTENEYRKC